MKASAFEASMKNIDQALFEHEVLAQEVNDQYLGAIGLAGLSAEAQEHYSQHVKDPTFGSAREYLAAEGTPEQAEKYEYVWHDARTQLFEGITRSGHISRVRTSWNQDEGAFFAYGSSMLDMYENATTVEGMPDHERQRRWAELDEEYMVTTMFIKGQLEGKALLTISPYPDGMNEKTAGEIGYRAENKKFLLRWHEVDGTERTIDSLSMSGSDLTVLNRLYRELGYVPDHELTDVEMLQRPILIDLDQIGKVADIAKMIDVLKGGTVYGEKTDKPANYDNLLEISQAREQRAEAEIDNFANKWIEAERTLKGRAKIRRWNQVLRESIANIILDQPEFGDSVGEQAKQRLEEARRLIDAGQHQQAYAVFAQGLNEMKISGACGGIGMIGDEELFSIDAMLDPFGQHKNKDSENEYSAEMRFNTNCPHCKQKNVTATIKNCKISCSNDGCSASKGIALT